MPNSCCACWAPLAPTWSLHACRRTPGSVGPRAMWCCSPSPARQGGVAGGQAPHLGPTLHACRRTPSSVGPTHGGLHLTWARRPPFPRPGWGRPASRCGKWCCSGRCTAADCTCCRTRAPCPSWNTGTRCQTRGPPVGCGVHREQRSAGILLLHALATAATCGCTAGGLAGTYSSSNQVMHGRLALSLSAP